MVNYHLVWMPKRRKKVLVGDIERRLREIIRRVGLHPRFKNTGLPSSRFFSVRGFGFTR
ncbi:MAG: transposase [Coleofasciculus sp.]